MSVVQRSAGRNRRERVHYVRLWRFRSFKPGNVRCGSACDDRPSCREEPFLSRNGATTISQLKRQQFPRTATQRTLSSLSTAATTRSPQPLDLASVVRSWTHRASSNPSEQSGFVNRCRCRQTGSALKARCLGQWDQSDR